MTTFPSGPATDRRSISIDLVEPASARPHPAILLLHGSGGAGSYWLQRFAPLLNQAGIAAYAPRFFESTGTERATPELILDGHHFPLWLHTVEDALAWIAGRPGVDPNRLAVLGVSLGGFLAMALAAERSTSTAVPRLRAAIEISGGIPPGWETKLAPTTAPTLVIHGDRDTVVPVQQARHLQDLLIAHNIPHQIDILPGETHWFSPAAQMRLLLSVGGFLQRHL